MGSETELYKVQLDVLGTEGMAKLKQEIDDTKASIVRLAEQYGRGEISGLEFIRSGDKLRASLKKQEDAFDLLSGKVGKGGDFGYAMMQGAAALEDLQYGINGVVNNVPGLLMGLGAGAGATAVVQGLAIAVNQLYNHWNEWVGALGGPRVKTVSDQIADLKKKVDDLEKKPGKIALDVKDLDIAREKLEQLEKLEATIKGQKGAPTDADAARASAVRKAVTEAPQGALAEALVDTGYAPIAGNPGVKQARDAFEKAMAEKHRDHTVADEAGVVDPVLTKMSQDAADAEFKKARDNLRAAINTAADEALGHAENNQGDFDALLAHMQANPERFKKDLPRFLKAGPYRDDIVKAQQEAIDAMGQQGAFEHEQSLKQGKDHADAIDAMSRQWAMEDAITKQRADARALGEKVEAAANKANAVVPNLPAREAPARDALAEEMARRGESPAWRAARRRPTPKPTPAHPGWENLDAPAQGPDQQGGINPDAGGKAIDLTAQLLGVAGQAVAQNSDLIGKVEAMGRQVADLRRKSEMNNGRIRGMNPTTAGSWNPLPFAGLS